MPRGKRTLHRETWWIKEYPDALEYVKKILDSESHPDKNFDTTSGRRLLVGEYSILSKQGDETNKKRMANAMVKLLDDPDYSCDAIPVASELGLEEAKEWFLNLSKKSLEEIRYVKTNGYTNALYCLLNYVLNNYSNDFLNFIEKILFTSNNRLELLRTFTVFSELEPDLALAKFTKYLPLILNAQEEVKKIIAFNETTWGFYKKYGYGFSVELAKILKDILSSDEKLALYKSLKQNPTQIFKSYLEELKKILEISD